MQNYDVIIILRGVQIMRIGRYQNMMVDENSVGSQHPKIDNVIQYDHSSLANSVASSHVLCISFYDF